MSENLLEKVITTTHIGSGTAGRGLLTAEQSQRFRDYMEDQSVLLRQARTVAMRSDVMDIDRMGIGKRLLRGATEGVSDPMPFGVVFSKVSLTAVKLRLDWELTEETLEDNIEGRDLEDHVARLVANQIGQDLEDLAINGNKDVPDPLLGFLDGWMKLAKEGGNVIDGTTTWATGNQTNAAGQLGWTSRLMSAMLREVPRREMGNRSGLRFFAGSDFMQEHMDSSAAAAATANNWDPRAEQQRSEVIEGPYGLSVIGNGGVRLQEVPLMYTRDDASYTEEGAADTYDVLLTNPQNLVWGVRRAITMYREFKPKKDAIEFTVFVRVAANIENENAVVVTTNVAA